MLRGESRGGGGSSARERVSDESSGDLTGEFDGEKSPPLSCLSLTIGQRDLTKVTFLWHYNRKGGRSL